jgi:hypothetical protein
MRSFSMTARLAGALALAAIVVLHVVALVRLVDRTALDGDESEFLHAGLRMARGERIYVDFAEHHAPIVFQLLSHLDHQDLRAYVRRARAFSTVCGAIALAAAAFLVWRATRRLYAPAILIGGLAAEPLIMARAFADVRSEPLALALVLLGALLIVIAPRRPAVGALGVGLIVFAFLVNPKWPLSSLALCLVFVIGAAPARRLAYAAVAAAGAFLLLAVSIDPRTYFDFVFLLNRALFRWKMQYDANVIGLLPPFFFCPTMLLPKFVVPAAVLVAFAAARVRDAFADVRLVWGSLLLAATSLIELRFVHPFPVVLWPQYLIVWAFAASAIYALVPQAVVALVPPRVKPVARATAVVFTSIALLQGIVNMPTGSIDPATKITGRLAGMLGPGDTVFLGMNRHPLGAVDASYYWFGFSDVVPASLAFAKTPRGRAILPPIREEDLPPCRLERGLDPHLRLVGSESLEALPIVKGCVQRLLARGVLVRTRAAGVYRVRRPGELE